MCDTTFVRDKKSNLFVQTNLVIFNGRNQVVQSE